MTSEPNWNDLIVRLEDDLRARETLQSDPSLDEEAWLLAAQLLRSRARIVTLGYPQLQPADVEDLVQSVLLKMQSTVTIRRLRAARSTEGYVYVMLRNAAHDLLRRRQFEQRLFNSLDDQANQISAEFRLVERTEAASMLGEALQSVNESDMELLRMRFWRNMSIAEIAKENSMSYSGTAVRLFRLLHRLRERLNRRL